MQPEQTHPVGDEPATPDHIASSINAPAIEPRRILQDSLRDWQAYLDSGVTAYADVAAMRLTLLIQRWDRDRGQGDANHDDPHSGASAHFIMKDDFFVWESLFRLYEGMVHASLNPPELDQAVREFAIQSIRPMERGPNNRAIHFALGALRAAQLFPDLPQAGLWTEYAEAVWRDWYEPGDSYEPGYVAHHFAQIIELGRLLGRQTELRSDKARAAFRRLAQHVAPSGRVIQPGDGGERDQEAYEHGLLLAALETEDSELAWVAQLNLVLGNKGPRDREERDRLAQPLTQKGLVPVPPTPFQGVQHLFAQTHPVADRLILQQRDAGRSPYLAFYLNDQTDTTFHGHEDNRGEIYHYEVEGAFFLRREGWSKWPGHANTFVVTEDVDEFPHYYTRGMTPGHTYKARTNLRLLQHYLPSACWEYHPTLSFQGMPAFRQKARPDLGFAWTNPDALSKIAPPFRMKDMIIRWTNFPARQPDVATSHYLQDLDFLPGMAWYREQRSVAPAASTYTVQLDQLALSGPEGRRECLTLNTIPDSLALYFYPAGAGRDAEPVIIEGEKRNEYIRLINKGPGGRTVMELRCPPGRMDLVFRDVDHLIDLRKDHWIELDYQIDEAARNFLRPPLRLAVDGLTPRSMYPDRQQGGCLVTAETRTEQSDAFARLQYDGIWTHDSRWERKAVLTMEGYLVVLDTFVPGASAAGLAGGPVWQLAAPPAQGLHWFDSPPSNTEDKRVMVYFHPARGREYGVSFHPKLWDEHHGYAVYARERFEPNRPCRFLTVFIPHAASVPPGDISGKRHFHGGLDSASDPAHGLHTLLDDNGNATVHYLDPARGPDQDRIIITLNADDSWSVHR